MTRSAPRGWPRVIPYRALVSKRARSRLAWAGVAVLVALAVWLGLSLVVASQLTSRARPPFDEPAPRGRWPGVEEVQLRTSDGQRLGAWFAPGEGPGPVVVLLHGNGGCRSSMVDRGELLLELGASVLAPSMRAHGDSTGTRNDVGFSARLDVLAAVAEAEARRPGRPVVVHGYSMGAAAATFAAETLGDRVSGYVLEAPYRDLRRAVRSRTRMYLPPVLEQLAYGGLVAASWAMVPQAGLISPERAVAAVPERVPVLIIAGSEDRRAPPDDACALYGQVRSHGRLEIIRGADHETLTTAQPERYRALVRSMLQRAREPLSDASPPARPPP